MKVAIVKDFYIDSAHIMIDDTYCRDKTEEDTKKALDNIAVSAYPFLLRKHMQKMEKLTSGHNLYI